MKRMISGKIWCSKAFIGRKKIEDWKTKIGKIFAKVELKSKVTVKKIKNKIEFVSEIRKKYKEASNDIKELFRNDYVYKKKENQEKIKKYFGEGMPKSFNGLIVLLGGNDKYTSRDYVKALMESKEEGEKWLIKYEEELKEKQELPSKIRETYKNALDVIKNLFGSSKLYRENEETIKKYFGEKMPDSFVGLITLLGGDKTQSQSGDYVKALMESEKEGENWLRKYKEELKEKQELPSKIREKYKNAPNDIKELFSSIGVYQKKENQEKIKKYFGEGMPKSFKGLIRFLGGNNKYDSGDYVKALMKSEEAGKKWLEENNR